jgi:hypothetical protein
VHSQAHKATGFTYPCNEFTERELDSRQPDFDLDMQKSVTSGGISPTTDICSTGNNASPSLKLRCGKPRCNATFDDLHELRLHNEQAHNRLYHCTDCTEPRCRRSFTRKWALRRHVAETTFPCPYARCGYARQGFKRRDYLQKHLKRIHP